MSDTISEAVHDSARKGVLPGQTADTVCKSVKTNGHVHTAKWAMLAMS